MIYADVTGGCVLPLQSGIPRVTRRLFRMLRENRPETRPLAWQPFRFGYTELSARARAILEDRFQTTGTPPRDTTGPFLAACLRDLALPWPASVPLRRDLHPGDTLLLTSLFPDNRLEYLDRLMTGPGRRIALFHDAIPLLDPNVPRWEKRRHFKMLALLAKMDRIISVSEASKKILLDLWREHRLSAAPIKVIALPPPFDEPRPAFSSPGEEANVLYVARLKETKNHSALLTACRDLWRDGLEFSLTLIGCEDEAKESARILREIGRLRREGRPVTWRAQVSEEELHAAYRACTFTAFPSRGEGYGLPIVESFWHGRPVICSGSGAMGEVSQGNGAVHVDVADAPALAAALRALLVDRRRCLELARAAYARPVRTWADYGRELEPALA